MGRGRAKAKQTKVARELKYSTPNTDLTALQRELAAREALESPGHPGAGSSAEDSDVAKIDDDDDDDDWVASR